MPINQALRIEADPDRGFFWPYYLYVPGNVSRDGTAHLLVEMNNARTTGPTDEPQVHDQVASQAARQLIERGHPRQIAQQLRVPLLVPAIPRPTVPTPEGTLFTQMLDRDTLTVRDWLAQPGDLERIDLQLVAMIRHAQDLLAGNGVAVRDRVFMHGFSATGDFTNRFATLHPHIVRAAAAGGVNGVVIFPTAEWEGRRLRYPVGIADIQAIAGIDFDMEAYRQVSQYIYMGYLDKNDPLPYRDAFAQQDAELIVDLLAEDLIERWEGSKAIYAQLGVPAQMVLYNGTAHLIRPEMLADIITFFRANSGDEIVQIEPHPYPYVPYQKLTTARIKAAYWPGDARLPDPNQTFPANTFFAEIEDWREGQDAMQLRTLWESLDGRDLVLQAPGYPDVRASWTRPQGWVSGSGAGVLNFVALQMEINAADFSRMAPGVPYTIRPVGHDLTVREGVTLTRPSAPGTGASAGPGAGPGTASPAAPSSARVIYAVAFEAGAKTAAVSIQVQDPLDQVSAIRLTDSPGVTGHHRAPADFITDMRVTAGVLQPSDRGSMAYSWNLRGVTEGTLTYTVKTDIESGGGYAGYAADDWIMTNGAFLFMVRDISATGPAPGQLLRVHVPDGWVAHTAFPAVEPLLFDSSDRRGAVFPVQYPRTFIVAGDRSVMQTESRVAGGTTFTAVAPAGARRSAADVADLIAAVGPAFQDIAGWGPPRVMAVIAPAPLRQGGEAGLWSYMAGDSAPLPPDLDGDFALHSHELFHVYQDYIPLEGWLNEGIATYYQYYGLLRAGRLTAQQFWDRMQSVLQSRAGQTLAQDPYAHGSIIAMAADILLRLDSGGGSSLDDVIRYLNMEHGPAPITAEDFVQIMSRFTGRAYDEFLNQHIRGDKLPTAIFERAGPELYAH